MNQRFRRSDAPRLTPQQAARQGRASSLAVATLRTTDAVRGFLNTHDEALGGRPIDLAVESDEGLATVERALAARAAS